MIFNFKKSEDGNDQMIEMSFEMPDNQKEILATQKNELILLRNLGNDIKERQGSKTEILPIDFKPI